MSSESFSFESMDALEQAISTLRTRSRSEDQPKPNSVEITFDHTMETAELSAAEVVSEGESCCIDAGEIESEDEESDDSPSSSESEPSIEIPDVSGVESVSQETTENLLMALDNLGGMATSSQVADTVDFGASTVSSYFSRLHSAGHLSRTPNPNASGRQYIYILD